MKQTAVEQLEEYLTIYLGKDRMRLLFNEFEKAKQMEKQQQDEFAILFAEWYLDYYDNYVEGNDKSTIELLEIYKKEKGL